MPRKVHQEQHEAPDAALDDYFGTFESTAQLAEKLIQAGSNAQELLILLCARLDALASGSVREGMSNKRAFCQFLAAYGGHRALFESISVGDLYYELGYHRWLLEGTIPKPGRIQRFSRVDDPIIYLLQESGVPLTVRDCERLLARIMRELRGRFRVIPRQRAAKLPLAKSGEISQILANAFDTPRNQELKKRLPTALNPLLEAKKVATILYERYRSESIHGGKVLLDEPRFYKATEPYWRVIHSDYYGSLQLIEFPAQFLVSVLRRCLRTYRAHLLKKGKLPPDVHFHAFGDENLNYIEFLDEELLPQVQQLRMKID